MPDETMALRALIVEAQNLITHARQANFDVHIAVSQVRFHRRPDVHAQDPTQLRPGSHSSQRSDLDTHRPGRAIWSEVPPDQ